MSNSAPTLPICCSRLIVCEKSGDWANLLRRSLDDRGRWIVETRSHSQLAAALVEHPASLCIVEVTTENLVRAATCMEQLHRSQPHCHLVAASGNNVPSAESLLMEAGASFIVHSRRDVDVIERLWQSHCRLHPPREVTLREQIFESLPLH